MKLIICGGFIWVVMPCTLTFDSLNGVADHDSMAAGG
jgi:hypothetical protein